MTEGQDRLAGATEQFGTASKAVSDHIGRAVVGSTGHEPAGAPLDWQWAEELDRLEVELNRAIAELLLAARQVMGENAATG
jgi:hypothetical protein